MKTSEKITKGADPELMLFDNEICTMVSAINVLNNDKDTPSDLGDGIKMYADNVMIECAFPPADTNDGFLDTLKKALTRMTIALGPRYRLYAQAAMNFDDTQLHDPRAWAIGCHPNTDVYSGTDSKPGTFADNMRTGSFHLHLGHSLLLPDEAKRLAVRLMDIFVGCPSVIFDRDYSITRRRSIYGKAGEYRKTPYGIEYRVLGNYALRSPNMVELVLLLSDYAMQQVFEGNAERIIANVNVDVVKSAINAGSAVAAQEVIESCFMPKELQSLIWKDYGAKMQEEWGLKS